MYESKADKVKKSGIRPPNLFKKKEEKKKFHFFIIVLFSAISVGYENFDFSWAK
jgi:hypothetical protein